MTLPLHLHALPPDRVVAVLARLERLLPRGRTFSVEVAHDAGCPCADDSRPIGECTCATVDVAVWPVQ